MKLFFSMLVTLGAGTIAGVATASSIGNWYFYLNKPSFNPPNWLFAPVWTILYILMGIALFLVWRSPLSPARSMAMLIFFLQLMLNFVWSFIFFTGQQVAWALADIILLFISIIVTMAAFYPLSKKAMWLLLPYFLWVSFACILNFSIWQLNK